MIERKSTSNHTENGEAPAEVAKRVSAGETKSEEKEEKNSGEEEEAEESKECRHSKR